MRKYDKDILNFKVELEKLIKEHNIDKKCHSQDYVLSTYILDNLYILYKINSGEITEGLKGFFGVS